MTFSPLTTLLVSALLVGGGAAVIYLTLRNRPSHRPQGALEWAGVTFSLLAVLMGGGVGLLTLMQKASSGGKEKTVIGEPAPRLRFRLVDSNEPRTLRDYRGKVVLLNLWATWCPPCLDELPQLNRFQETYGPKGVVVVTISDERRNTIQRFEREQLQLKTVSGYLPPDRNWPSPYDRVLQSRPTSFVIDRKGIIRNTWAGAEDFATFKRVVAPHL